MRKLTLVNNQGQALLELILSISIASFFLTTFVVGIISVREAFNHSSISAEAKFLLQKEVEALRSIKETSWDSFSTAGTYHVEQNVNIWEVKPGTIIENNLTHGFTVADVCRLQATLALEDCSNPLSTPDSATKKITATVSWSFLGNESISSSLYLTRTFNNTVWTQTTQAEFNAGTKTNTQVVNNAGGEVELTQSSSTADYGNKFRVTATSAIGNMTSLNHKTSLRFTAQESKTVNAIRVYLQAENGNSPQYRYGIQTNNPTGNVPTGTWVGNFGTLTTNSPLWKTITLGSPASLTAGTIYHIVVEPTGSPGNPTGSANIGLRRSTPQNLLYPKTNIADPQANTLLKTSAAGAWVAQGFQPIYELDFSDSTFEGNPFETSTQISVFGVNRIGEKFTVTGGNKTATNISFFVSQNSATEPLDSLQVELRDSSNFSLASGTLATAAQTNTTYAYFTYTFPSPITLTNGSVYRIFLKSPLSNATNFYRVYRVAATNAANYNSITYDGTNSVYTNSTNSGSTWTDTPVNANVNWDIGGYFFNVTLSAGYATSGTFESKTFDCYLPTAPATAICNGTKAGYNFVTMTVNEPVPTNVRLQIATNSVDGPIWNFVGPDGSGATYFDNLGTIPLIQANGRYFRFKVFLTGNGAITPIFYDATVNYSP